MKKFSNANTFHLKSSNANANTFQKYLKCIAFNPISADVHFEINHHSGGLHSLLMLEFNLYTVQPQLSGPLFQAALSIIQTVFIFHNFHGKNRTYWQVYL